MELMGKARRDLKMVLSRDPKNKLSNKKLKLLEKKILANALEIKKLKVEEEVKEKMKKEEEER
jgi:hypothetical protein